MENLQDQKTSREYKFGNFNERLDHICLLFGADKPSVEFDNEGSGEPLLTDGLFNWTCEHEVNLDWLFLGNPDGLLCQWAKRKTGLGYAIEQVNKMNRDELVYFMQKLEAMKTSRARN